MKEYIGYKEDNRPALLHELLRELTNWHQLYELYSIREVSFTKLMESFADEIERYYIPRPRFDDGTPLKNGDEIDYCGRAEQVVSYLVCDTTRDDVDYGMRYAYATLHLKNGTSYNVPLDEPLKRPTPKVYDAEGVRICKGDTVWHANHQWIVVGIVYHEGKPWIQIDNTDGKAPAQERQPFDITHREPDSLEKLRDDMSKFMACGCMFDDRSTIHEVQAWEDRLTALIESGA